MGKTWLARDLAKRHGLKLVEINFERNPELAEAFDSNDVDQILADLSLSFGPLGELHNLLLFLDEIQAKPSVLAKLRWFAESDTRLAVIAAGSLLEFALSDASFSMPVGRVTYRYVGPMSFDEYLCAHGQEELRTRLQDVVLSAPTVSTTLHNKATNWFDRFKMVGGMPAVVAADACGESPASCRGLQTDLLMTYRDDFAKYSGQMAPSIIDETLRGTVRSLGQKFVATKVNPELKSRHVRSALELLIKAGLCTSVPHTAANGLPLLGEGKHNKQKILLLDIGLCHALLSTPATTSFPRWSNLAPQIRGQLSEQVIGQQLRVSGTTPGGFPQIHYWHRQGGRAGEVDFIVQLGHQIIPVEIKAGAAGAMKSLHQFMADKHLPDAIRIDQNPPSVQHLDLKTNLGTPVQYRLFNLPHYLSGRVADLVVD